MHNNKLKNRIRDAVAYIDKNQLDAAKQLLEEMSQNTLYCSNQLAVAYNKLGILYAKQSNDEDALHWFLRALAADANLPDTYNNLGMISLRRQNLEDASSYFEKSVERDPNNVTYLGNLAVATSQQKNYDVAERALARILALRPRHLEALISLANLYFQQKKYEQAKRYFEKVLAIDKAHPEAVLTLAEIHEKTGDLKVSLTYCNYALSLARSNQSLVYNLMAKISNRSGETMQALEYYRKAFTESSNVGLRQQIYSNYLLTLNYHNVGDQNFIYQQHCGFQDMLSATPFSSYDNSLDTQRKLRIGYLSPDFKAHPVMFFILPTLIRHDRNRFEIYCYSCVEYPDEVTAQVLQVAEYWRDIHDMKDDEVADLIREDNIDILVDLAGHTAGNRIAVLARKPAPLQISWIGYPNTTGLADVDYRITDHYADPVAVNDTYYTETLLRMNQCFLSYLPIADAPDTHRLHRISDSEVVFGCFNNFSKVTDEILQLWTEILKKTPESRLLLKDRVFADGDIRLKVAQKLEDYGADSSSIQFLTYDESFLDHLRQYNRVDIALDTYPYNGTTTTCEALYMGVPVVSLAGSAHASRVGVSLLSNCGLAELLAYTPEEYVEKATELAQNIGRLRSLKDNLREMLKCSPLMNHQEFARELEDNYRKVWLYWCERKSEAKVEDTGNLADGFIKTETILEKIEALQRKVLAGCAGDTMLLFTEVVEDVALLQRNLMDERMAPLFVAVNDSLNAIVLSYQKKDWDALSINITTKLEPNMLEVKRFLEVRYMEIINQTTQNNEDTIGQAKENSATASEQYPPSQPVQHTADTKPELKENGKTSKKHGQRQLTDKQLKALNEKIKSFPYWYHKIELPGGVSTPGWAPLDREMYRIPDDLTGMRVLDVGAWDGFWTFEALKRGAKQVVAIDDFSDFLGELKNTDRKAWENFDLCKEALGYSDEQCKRFEMSVYDIHEKDIGRFDIVFFFGVLYHLRHPLLALDKLASICDKELYVETAILDDFSPFQGGLGKGYSGQQIVAEFYSQAQYGNNPTNWWAPTIHCLLHMMLAAGFSKVDGWKLKDNPQKLSECRGFAKGVKTKG